VLARSAHPDDRAIAEAIVEQLEENELARVDALANAIANRTVEGLFIGLGLITRR
jgi:stage V sporulation protein SpoVS